MVSVKPTGVKSLRRQLEEARERARDLRPVMRGAAAALDALIQRGFRSGSGPNGESWPPLEDATIQRKGSSRPLIDTGALSRSTFADPMENGLMFGVSGRPARYAATHQFGRDAIPARPFLPVDASGEPKVSGGKAKRWHRKHMRDRVRRYIVTGKL